MLQNKLKINNMFKVILLVLLTIIKFKESNLVLIPLNNNKIETKDKDNLLKNKCNNLQLKVLQDHGILSTKRSY